MVSMESFGPVSVDYFNGRHVEEVTDAERYPEDALWWIKFEGGGLVANVDETIPVPPQELVGLSLMLTVLGVKEGVDEPKTMLYFGDGTDPRKYVVSLTAIDYAICDEVATRGTWVFAERSQANMPQVPEEDADRLQEGPEEQNG